MRVWLDLRSIAAGKGSTLPSPGSGGTAARFAALADWAARDLSLARLLEGHVDALAILEEADLKPTSGAIYGVWGERPLWGGTTARLTAEGWHLTGTKSFCWGSSRLDRALVTAECADGYRLFDISVAESVVRVHPSAKPIVGRADSLNGTLEFGGPPLPATSAVGPPGFYLARPGFWFRATGEAACWSGGASGLVGRVLQHMGPHPSELVVGEIGHAAAHIDSMRRVLQQAAEEIDDDPEDRSGEAKRRALVVRHAVHHAAQEVLVHVAAAGGARPFYLDAEQARLVADLYMYLAQDHGPHDVSVLGTMACDGWPWS
jgi:alkylation response protein AidB-like acyl-CoA dehydrogenase